MRKHTCTLLGGSFLTAVVLGILWQALAQYQAPAKSLFDGDVCAPPCWFGLVPGKSTLEEVSAFVRAGLPKSMDWQAYSTGSEETANGVIVEGWYDGYWREFHRPIAQSNSVLAIQNNTLHFININTYKEVSLGQMLNSFGLPDHMRLALNGYGFTYMRAFYHNWRLRIYIDMNPFYQTNVETTESCTFQNPTVNFFVDSLTYFSPQAAQELVSIPDGRGVAEPSFFAYHSNEYDVPSEMLTAWLNGEETADCRTVWERLAQAQGTPIP